MITKNIGGDRLGSGSKMQVQMHNYERSTHDLSSVWRSSMQVGTLTPFMVEVGLNGDTFDIDLTAMVRTLPTISPLYGSFKLQMDVFEIPMRLYNGILHNNALKIGNNMQKVKFPKIKFDVKVGRVMNTDRPFMVEVGLNGDTFDIDLTAMVRTLPTISPLFGSFKLQMDVFEIPMRLYNGILHNNALKIGNNMQKVKFPKIKFDVKVGRVS